MAGAFRRPAIPAAGLQGGTPDEIAQRLPGRRPLNAWQRALGAAGAIGCAAAVALAAIASHALQGGDSHRASLAAAFAFGHGLALVALARHADSRIRLLGLGALAAGVVLFSGSLATAAFAGTSTALAPAGGMLLMLGWAFVAAGVLRR